MVAWTWTVLSNENCHGRIKACVKAETVSTSPSSRLLFYLSIEILQNPLMKLTTPGGFMLYALKVIPYNVLAVKGKLLTPIDIPKSLLNSLLEKHATIFRKDIAS